MPRIDRITSSTPANQAQRQGQRRRFVVWPTKGEKTMLRNMNMTWFPSQAAILLLSAILASGCATEAERKFGARPGSFTVSVYPVNVIQRSAFDHDVKLADEIVSFLKTEGLAQPRLVNEPINYPFEPSNNQQKMLKRSAKSFSDQIAKEDIATDYALLVEILCYSGETRLHGVHFYLSDPDGNIVDIGLTNSHWKEFREVQPRSRHDGYEVAIRMLRRKWGK
jgi:hypothetical protein